MESKTQHILDIFVQWLSGISPCSPATRELIRGAAQVQWVEKKQMLIHDLATCEHLYFIHSGLARAYFYHEGKEMTDWFGKENMLIGPLKRRFPAKSTVHPVEMIAPGYVVMISFAQLEHLYAQSHEVERLGRCLAIHSMQLVQQKLDDYQLLNATQRYEQFLIQYPDLIKRIPLQYIASFLGMNKVTLSKIRRSKRFFSPG